jgi:hypothetical protein
MADASVDPRPELPRIDLGAPLAGQWVKIDTAELRMADFETIDTVQQIVASGKDDGSAMVEAMPKLLRLMRHVVIATSLPGATITEALGELRPAEFMAVVAAFGGSASVPNES